MDFAAGHTPTGDQTQAQQPYSSSAQHSHFPSAHQYSYNSQQQQQQQQQRLPFPHSAVTGANTSGNASPEPSHPPSRTGPPGQVQPHQQSPTMQLDTSHMSSHRLGHGAFGSATSVTTPMYPPTSSPNPGNNSFVTNNIKRIRNEDFDLSMGNVSAMGQSGLESMPSNSIGAAYGQAAAAAAAASNVHQGQGHQVQQHHHHHLPDLGHLSKSLRREDGSGAPSMVGQAGMPPPAARPRGPKLKFTAEDDQLLIELKEQKNLTWKQIADFFPGRSSGTLQVRYCTKLKAKTTQWTDEMVRHPHSWPCANSPHTHKPLTVSFFVLSQLTSYILQDHKLHSALNDYENEKWRIVAHKVGSGFTPAACRERAAQLMGGDEADAGWQSMSPRSASAQEGSDSMELPQIHRPWHC